ncbi:MAG: RNA methyltransferase [Sideroxydans sp.]
MPETRRITSRDNPFYKSWLKLATSARARREAGQTLLDGAHLLQAWLAAGQRPLHLLVSDSGMRDAEIAALLARCPDCPQTRLDDRLFALLTELKTPSGVLALIEPRPAVLPAARSRFALLLETIQDPGNLGSMLRSAAAAGCDAVFLSPGCADAWSPRVLRAGMGGHFLLDIHEQANLLQVARELPGTLLAATLGAPRSLYQCDLRGPLAFAIGNEGAGLSAPLLTRAHSFVIPMPGAVESLNAAAATAVCLFEAVRQRTA